MSQDLGKLLASSKIVAIVGANEDPNKYGYKITKQLLELGWEVLPVNPNYQTVLGKKAYPTLADLPYPADITSFVVPPKVTNMILNSSFPKDKVKYLWFQPWAYDEESLELARQLWYEPIYGACVMLEAIKLYKDKISHNEN